MPENNRQGEQQESQYPEAESGEIVFNKPDHVGDNHGHAAQVDAGVVAVLLQYGANLIDGGITLFTQLLGVADKFVACLLKLRPLGLAGLAPIHLFPEFVTLVE